MPFLLPCEPGSPRLIDSVWVDEKNLLLSMGEQVFLVDHDALMAGQSKSALRRSGLPDTPQVFTWRGWMMSVEAMKGLEETLSDAGHTLLDDAHNYAEVHYLGNAYERLSSFMLPTHFIPSLQNGGLEDFLTSMTGCPLVVRDQEKSEASMWDKACFIPEPGDLKHSMSVVQAFCELRGNLLRLPLVFRPFTELRKGWDGKPCEWRVFVLAGKPIAVVPRTQGSESETPPSLNLLEDAASRIETMWWTMDWVEKVDGQWSLMETGWGGVSSCPTDVLREMVGPLSGLMGEKRGYLKL